MNNGEHLTEDELKEYNEAVKNYKIEDNRQMVFKKVGNSFFGAYGSNNGAVYPWKSIDCAERTTCTGRQSLRLMISHFKNLGNFLTYSKNSLEMTEEDNVYIKYIDTKIIEKIKVKDVLENSIKKPFSILIEKGWCLNGEIMPITEKDKEILLSFENSN